MELSFKPDADLSVILNHTINLCHEYNNEFLTPEHLLYSLTGVPVIETALCTYGSRNGLNELRKILIEYFNEMQMPGQNSNLLNDDGEPEQQRGISYTDSFGHLLTAAIERASSASKDEVSIIHILTTILDSEKTYAGKWLQAILKFDKATFLSHILRSYKPGNLHESLMVFEQKISNALNEDADYLYSNSEDSPTDSTSTTDNNAWKQLVTSISDTYQNHNELIGRERELDRTIQILCRKDKNNPLHVGEPGVGKTALIYGLARMIAKGNVPERLKGARIYRLDMGSLIAGTQYRGDFEKKLTTILDGASAEGNVIIYIDEIHTMMGAGAVNNDSLDASNMLKRYLEEDKLRFIGSTTYEEHKKFLAKDKAVSRRFALIDIDEPSVEETIVILNRLLDNYARYHNVEYADDVVEYTVRQSKKHIHDKFLPDKAIDLIDEAGAYRELHPDKFKGNLVDIDLISKILADICKVESLALKTETEEQNKNLSERILSHIYGQDKAVIDVTEAILMAQAGLFAEHKPLGSFLFVGPTGVGKTELAKVLSEQLGIGFVRFDMSEFSEKHSVAKLIGAPAGYVGYEEGGLLTDAIRRTPNCVLLLDELEKAHQDIYNILLQIMDYATLTDNQGRKADFSNVIIIMTSNAGAQYAAQSNIGFGAGSSSGSAMLKEIKRLFKPEFINRLTAVEVFNNMDRTMAELILDKELNDLRNLLLLKNIELNITESVREKLLDEGFSVQYGARELKRVINANIRKLLSREILFGRLKNGGSISIEAVDNNIILR